MEQEGDVWSIGCIAYELLTRHPPYYEESQYGSEHRLKSYYHSETKPVFDPKWSVECTMFLSKCFTFDPHQRPMVSQ